jgi:hypothetical protein
MMMRPERTPDFRPDVSFIQKPAIASRKEREGRKAGKDKL